MNSERWMAEIDDNKDLFSLNLAGTHDCVTKHVQFSYFAKCQDKTIAEQLSIGVRVLDIRTTVKDGRLVLVHGKARVFAGCNYLSRQMELSEVLSRCYDFLEANPTETVIFQFKNDSCREMEECFDKLYNSCILPCSDKWFLENRAPFIGEARGRLVLVRRCAKYEDREYPLGTGIDFSEWQEQDKITPEPLPLNTGSMDFVIQDRYAYKPVERWDECLKPFLDGMEPFCGKYIINYTSTAGGLKGPCGNAKYINKRLSDYELKKGIYYGIVYLDFADEALTEKIISSNSEELL